MSSHLYFYSTFNNTNCVKATAQYQNRTCFELKAFHYWIQWCQCPAQFSLNSICAIKSVISLEMKCPQQWRLVLKNLGGGRKQTESTGDLVQAPWSFFFLHPNALWTGIFVKIKPNSLSSRDIALASTLISTCLSTDELLLSGMRVVENGPITWGQTYKNNIDLL